MYNYAKRHNSDDSISSFLTTQFQPYVCVTFVNGTDALCLSVFAQLHKRPRFLCRGYEVDVLPVTARCRMCMHPGGKLTLPAVCSVSVNECQTNVRATASDICGAIAERQNSA